MYGIVITIHVIACFILIATILLQSGRGGGLADLFGGGTTQTIFGTRASTFLTRTTTVAAITFLLTCISLTIFSSRRGKSLLEGKRPEPVSEETIAPEEGGKKSAVPPQETQTKEQAQK